MKNNKNKVILWFVLSCVFLIFTKIAHLFSSLVIALKEYTPVKGLLGSSWTGFQNFNQIFSTPPGFKLFTNALRLNLVTALMTIIIAGIFIYFSNRIRNRKYALILTFVFALPAFMPQILTSGMVTFALGIKINNYYSLVYPLLEALRLSGYIALFSFFALNNTKNASISAGKLTINVLVLSLLVGISKILTSDFELAYTLSNPLIFDKADVIDTYAFRMGFMQMKISTASALWVVRYLLELVSGAFAAAGIFVLLKPRSRYKNNSDIQTEGDLVPMAVCTVLAAAMAAFSIASIIPKTQSPAGFEQLNILYNIVFLIACIAVSFASSALAAVMAYPFASKTKPIKIIYGIILVASLFASNHVRSYLLYKSLGMINTIFPVVLNGFLPVWMIAAYALLLNSPLRDEDTQTSYSKTVLPYSFIIAAIGFTLMWGSYAPSMIYTMDPSQYSAALAIRNVMSMGGQSLGLNLFLFVPIAMVWSASLFIVIKMQKTH